MRRYLYLFLVFLFFFQLSLAEKGRAEFLVCIDPGHQAKGNVSLEEIAPNAKTKKAKVSSGTRGIKSKKYEYALNLEIAFTLKEDLERLGYSVFLTREKNEVDISNKERALLVSEKRGDIYIRLHADGSENPKVEGASVLISSPKNIHTKKLQKEAELFAKILLEEYVKETGAKNRGIQHRDDLTGTNWSQIPTVLLEMGFLSNPKEDQLLQEISYQKKMRKGMVSAIEKYRIEGK